MISPVSSGFSLIEEYAPKHICKNKEMEVSYETIAKWLQAIIDQTQNEKWKDFKSNYEVTIINTNSETCPILLKTLNLNFNSTCSEQYNKQISITHKRSVNTVTFHSIFMHLIENHHLPPGKVYKDLDPIDVIDKLQIRPKEKLSLSLDLLFAIIKIPQIELVRFPSKWEIFRTYPIPTEYILSFNNGLYKMSQCNINWVDNGRQWRGRIYFLQLFNTQARDIVFTGTIKGIKIEGLVIVPYTRVVLYTIEREL